jgi:uncharacterized repeat protein (TIGR03803 family)
MTFFRLAATLALGAATAMMLAAGSPTIRAVATLHQYDQPVGIIEGEPGVFYAITSEDVFSVTSKGAITVLATVPNGTEVMSYVMSGPDNRFYSALGQNGVAQMFSVTQAEGGKVVYPGQDFAAELSQNLPDGTLLETAGWSGTSYFIKASTDGTITSIYQFPSGDKLLGNALYGSDGNYYGVACQQTGAGYMFRITPAGSLTKLYTFPSGAFDGLFTNAILQGNDGSFYGTTPTGGPQHAGTIYKITPSGQYTLLYAFASTNNGGPISLIEASDGDLYGATLGTVGAGNSQLFRLTKSGGDPQLFPLSDAYCYCGLVQGSDGNIYGTAVAGGTTGQGLVFVMNAGLPKPQPWAQQFGPQSGAPGARVRIWGQNLLSASVEFNGVPATAVSNSGSNYVWATAPAGATSGPITVTTPGGANTTQASFTVQ